MTDIYKVADVADMIISGYAFTKQDGKIRVLNLNHPDKATVMMHQEEFWKQAWM